MTTNPNKLSPNEIEALDDIWRMIDKQDTELTEAEIDELERLHRAKKKGSGTPHEL